MVNDMKQKSIQAQVSSSIRKELKQFSFIKKPSVKSESFAGGNAVTVFLEDVNPDDICKIRELCRKYEYGKYDSQQEYYDYNNVKSDLPQVKYCMVEVKYSPELRQSVYEFLIKQKIVMKTSELFKDIPYYDDTVDMVSKYLSGSRKGFWE